MNAPIEILPSNQKNNVEIILLCDGNQFNVSNLCKPGYFRNSSHRRKSLGDSITDESLFMQRIKPKRDLKSLYPSPNAIIIFKNTHSKVQAPQRCYSEPIAMSTATSELECRRIDESTSNSVIYNNGDQKDIESSFFFKNEFHRPFVELAPNHWIQLRGSDETLCALRKGICRSLKCSFCYLQIVVINDAAMALCPGCRLVIPADKNGIGLGLGLKKEEFDRIRKNDSSDPNTPSRKSPLAHQKEDTEFKR
jgi:hypothetical protein